MSVARLGRRAGATALLLLAGCTDVFGPTGPEVLVSLRLQEPPARPLSLQVLLGGKRIEVTTGAAAGAETAWRGPRFGDVPGRVALLGPSGDTLASAALTIRFERENVHWITARVGANRPLGHCIGALTVLPLEGAATDTLFLTVGRLSKGAIC